MASNKFTILGNSELVWSEIDNSLMTVDTKVSELISEVANLKEQIASVRTTTSEPLIPSEYVLAKDTDFEWMEDCPWEGAWHYVGTDDKVAIPHRIQGQEVTSYRGMFYQTSVSGVYSNNTNVTDMRHMFCSSKAKVLDLSNFDTSNVTDMANMFSYSKAKTLDLSSFNTSNVTDMVSMFDNSQATILDLSSFDITKVGSMTFMFYNSKANILNLSSFDTSNVVFMNNVFQDCEAKIVYARTKKDIDKFSNSIFGPSKITFIA